MYYNPHQKLPESKVNKELEILRYSIRHICRVMIYDGELVYSVPYGTASGLVEKYITPRIKELGLSLTATHTFLSSDDSFIVTGEKR